MFSKESDFKKKPIKKRVSLYERPAVSLANLMQGRFGAALQSIFNPEELSFVERRMPWQVIGLTTDNKLVEAGYNLASNPLVWLGIILSVKFKVGSTKTFINIANDNKPIGALTGWLHSSWDRVRHIPGLGDDLQDVTAKTASFMEKHAGKLDKAVGKYVNKTGMALSETDDYMLSAYIQKWHKPGSSMIVKDREWGRRIKNQFGIDPKRYALTPNIDKKMSPELRNLGDDISKIMDDIFKEVTKTEGLDAKKIFEELRGRGLEYIPEGYLPRIIRTSGTDFKQYAREAARAGQSTKREYDAAMYNVIKSKTASSMKQRLGNSLPDAAEMDKMVDMGIMPSSTRDMFEQMAKSKDNDFKARFLSWLVNEKRDMFSAKEIDNLIDITPETVRSSGYGAMETFLKQQGVKKDVIDNIVNDIHRLGTNTEALNEYVDAFIRKVSSPARYQVKTTKALERYIQDMSPTYAWHTTGLGEKILTKTKTADPRTKELLNGDVIPLIRGLQPWKKQQRSIAFNEYKARMLDMLEEKNPITKTLPSKTVNWLKDSISESKGIFSPANINSAISHHYYLSMMGMNLGSASKNSMQNFITTTGVIGKRNTLSGIVEVSKRIPSFMGKAYKSGVDEALKSIFPEYVSAVGPDKGLARQILRSATTTSKKYRFGGRSAYDKFVSFMMGPFAATERANRLIAFYSGQKAAVKAGLNTAEAAKVGEQLVKYTQFPGGVLGIPSGFLNVPSPLRQFAHFPLRYAAMLDDIAFRSGSKDIALGGLGRIGLASTVLSGVSRDVFNTDIEAGLMMGALPQPTWEGQPFYPFPIVPPIAGTLGEAYKTLHTGRIDNLGRTISTVVPGGIAGRRAYRSLHPKYAGYKNRAPDGKIPMYNDRGQLIGHSTGWQLALKAAGLNPNNIREEQEMVGYLVKHRDNIRNYRAEYIKSIMNNDINKAMKIRREYKRKYPELNDLQIRKSDIESAKNKREVSRLYRIYEGFRKEDKPIIKNIIDTVAVGRIIQDIDDNPNSAYIYQSESF